jgi:arylsulfatase A-like enzyme
MSLAIVGLVFAEALFLGRVRVQGWTFYLTAPEVVFEFVVRLVFGAMAGLALGTLCTALATPFIWGFQSLRQRLAERIVGAAAIVVLFIDSRFALITLLKWSKRGLRFLTALLICHFLFFVVTLFIPRVRQQLSESLELFVGKRMAPGMAIATIAIATLLAIGQGVLSKSRTSDSAAVVKQPAGPSILLTTFDALNAEDMSAYGYKLPTTPNIDAFARNATVFTNFYATSTFTTPTIATVLTGMYPSDSRIHQLQSRLRREDVGKTLPRVLGDAGYANGGFFSNPFAHYLVRNAGSDYDLLSEPVFQEGALQWLWEATRFLHQDSGVGSRLGEYMDLEDIWNTLTRVPGNLSMRLRPETSFEEAWQLLDQLSDRSFVWVHVITPHSPYLPAPADHGRFLPPEKLTTREEQSGRRWQPHYEPGQQGEVDQRRLRYDEFIATADRAFGTFISKMEQSGKLRDRIVIISADHGESFEGGVYQHSSPYLTRPVVHIPLIVKMPGQLQARTITHTADQTALAPTILELAGQPRPERMRGQSLVGWLDGKGQTETRGLAFTQYLERNSSFAALQHGTVGVIDGEYEYVLDIETRKGTLRPITKAQFWDLDYTTENRQRAETLRNEIYARFPELGPISE